MTVTLKDKRIFVTGACGTIGKELIRQLLEEYQVKELIGVDNNESELFFLEQKLRNFSNAAFYLTDVRDKGKLDRKMKGMDIVFHTAAYKHVILCERSPFEAVQTNIIGVQNVINAAISNRVEKVIFTSTDKAVNPTNVMGTSKLMGERLITAANSNLSVDGPILASTRFGNVLGSRGSVIPIFREQIRQGGPVTLTDENMTRFIMSIKEAVSLVINSTFLAYGGEVFITKMPVMRIKDLAEVMIEEIAPHFDHNPCNIELNIIGSKPGEKMYEELMNTEEVRRSVELKDYFVTSPAFKGQYKNIDHKYPDIVSNHVKNVYNSETQLPLSKSDLLLFLQKNNLLEDDSSEYFKPNERYWPTG